MNNAQRLGLGKLHASEDVLPQRDGSIIASDGDRIVSLSANGQTLRVLARTGGQNLGLARVDKNTLAIANHPKGLYLLDLRNGRLKPLATGDVHYPNGIAVSKDGKTLFFTDSSDKFYGEPWKYMFDLLEARPHGRLFKLDTESGKRTQLLDGLHYPNGLAFSTDEDALVFNETYRYRILRYWLKGPKTGKTEIFSDNLPGFPDGLSLDAETKTYWAAMFTPRNKAANWLHRHPFLKNQLAKLPQFCWPKPKLFGRVLVLDENGKIIKRYDDPSGTIGTLSSARKQDGVLYMGSLKGGYIGRLKL